MGSSAQTQKDTQTLKMKNRAKQIVTNVKSVQGRQITGFFPRAHTSSDSDAHLLSSNSHPSMHPGSGPQSIHNSDLRPSIATTDQGVTMGDSAMFQRSTLQGNGVLDVVLVLVLVWIWKTRWTWKHPSQILAQFGLMRKMKCQM